MRSLVIHRYLKGEAAVEDSGDHHVLCRSDPRVKVTGASPDRAVSKFVLSRHTAATLSKRSHNHRGGLRGGFAELRGGSAAVTLASFCCHVLAMAMDEASCYCERTCSGNQVPVGRFIPRNNVGHKIDNRASWSHFRLFVAPLNMRIAH